MTNLFSLVLLDGEGMRQMWMDDVVDAANNRAKDEFSLASNNVNLMLFWTLSKKNRNPFALIIN